jgi:hypothetical protein
MLIAGPGPRMSIILVEPDPYHNTALALKAPPAAHLFNIQVYINFKLKKVSLKQFVMSLFILKAN